MAGKKTNKDASTIYIIHRNADKAIGRILKDSLQNWCNGHVKIFQSSDVRGNAPKIGQSLSEAQKRVLSDTDVVFLVYTVADNEWLYCMWESGIATNPSGQSTEILVFQCKNDIPLALQNHIRVTPDQESIRQFTHDFHKYPKLFPNQNKAFTDEIDEKTIEVRSQDLFKGLSGICQFNGIDGQMAAVGS